MEKNLVNFTPDSKSFGFTDPISEIEILCDKFYLDFNPEDVGFARDEESFRNCIANIQYFLAK